jgi:hypothetical protein
MLLVILQSQTLTHAPPGWAVDISTFDRTGHKPTSLFVCIFLPSIPYIYLSEQIVYGKDT